MIRHKSSRYAYSTCILAAAVLIISVPQRAVAAALAVPDPVLDLYNTSLTKYLYDGNDGAGGNPGTTIAQEVRPLAEQRGVNLDGSLRLGSTHPMSLQGNPFGEAWNANMMLSGVRLDTGTYVINDVDLALPSPGPSWVIGRSYNARQEDDEGNHYDSNGYQGYNWFQSAHPEIVLFEGATDDLDVIYLVYGADRYIEFKRFDDTSTEFKSKNGAAGVIEFIDGGTDPDLYVYTDQRGWQVWFFGFDTDSLFATGQLWRIVAPKPGGGDYVAYVGHKTDAALAAPYYDYPGSRPASAEDSAGRVYTYSYRVATPKRLLKVEVKVSGTLVARVEYAYYGTSDNHGLVDDLKLVTISTPLTEDTSGYDPVKWLVRKKYYRYWKNTWTQNDPGHPHFIKYIYDFEGTRNFDWGEGGTETPPDLDDGFLAASNTDLKAYASAYFEYEENSYKIANAWFNGACGCSGSANGTHKFAYEDNGSYTANPGYDTTWKNRTIVERPTADETAFITQYFDEVGQPLHRVNTKLTPSDTTGGQKTWATMVVRNSDATNKIYGQITAIHSPANVTAYTHSTGILTTSTGAGLVTVFTRGTTGVLRGFLQDAKHKTGTNALDVYLDLTLAYLARTLDTGDSDVDRPVISSQRIYTKEITSGTTDSRLTSFGQTWHETSDATDVLYITPEILTTTFPVVSTGSNGPGGTALESKLYLNEAGQTVWQKTTDAIINYWQYKDDDGRLDKSIQDADTTHADFSGITVPSEFDSDGSDDELHLVTCFGYVGGTGMGMSDGGCTSGAGGDSVVTGDGPAAVTYRARLDDGRFATLVFPHFEDSTPDKYYGPVSYTVRNLAGQVELQGVIALSANSGEYTTVAPTDFIDELKDDPLEAIDHGGTTIGTVQQMSTSIFNETGLVLQQSRAYFIVPSSGTGTEGTDYDATRYAYDAMGRTARIKDPTGTIQRTVYDTRGRTTEQWTGTNDKNFDSGEPTGTDDMVKTVALEYDSGSDEGNSYLTKQTLFVESTATDKRESTFDHDVRGRVLLQVSPEEPKHVLSAFDNLGRLTASGLYSTGDGTDDVEAGDDPVTREDDRLTLNQSFYDELGRVYQSETHKIDMADGSDDDNLLTDNWYDARGRLIKVDGSQLMKYQYNRLGQQTHQFVLAVDNDTAYADAEDVLGDIVLQENQTVLNVKTGITLMSAVIDRDHGDFGPGKHTGALDDNGDADDLKYTAADIHGQIQINAYWYDSINRSEAVALYGTNAGNDPFTRASTVEPRSDTILVTTYAFNADGTLLSITDPEDLKTQYEYDDLGRQTAVINNYVNRLPSSLTADDDHVTRYVYDDGLRIKLWVDIYPVDFEDTTPDSEDQVTTYTYGVSAGDTPGASKFDSGRLLRQIKYPDSSGGTDVVLFAYNALGQQIWSRDQEVNIFQTDYDDVGREEHRRVTTLDAAFDGRILRITTVYDDLGRIETVSQYNNATVESGTIQDEVKYTYDGWGNVTNFEQDNNSAVGASGSIDDYEVKYTYAKATGGRNTIRRTKLEQLYASSIKKTLTYEYSSAFGLHDNNVSRVTKVKSSVGPSVPFPLPTVATYDYLGVGQIVGTRFPEPDVFSKLYTGSGYVHMDRFNRVKTNRWTKNLATDVDFYDVDISYDRDSSITLVEDNVHVGFDVDYTIDNLNRLQKAEEGTWSVSVITSRTRQQLWEDPSANPALDQLGNWTHVRLDLDGNNDFVGTNEYDDDRTHNIVNELTARDVNNDTTDDYLPTYDDLGELTDDKEFYEYKYDAFGRLIEIANTTTQVLVVEYTYNGLGHRTGWHYDEDGVQGVGNDPWFYFAYDEGWRIVATYRAADTSPKEQFVYHNAGLGGYGGSSAIDGIIMRDKDANTAWSAASDGTLEERVYYCQNWRGDVVALIDDNADQVEQDRYSSYGVPFGLPAGDADSDGDVDAGDLTQIQTWIDASAYDVRGDLDLNGLVNAADKTAATNNQGTTLGWGNLSIPGVGNRKGYGGYELDPVLAYTTWHVRYRVLISDLGRFATRDPVGYRGGMNLYQYVRSNPLRNVDPFGLIPPPGGGGGSGPTGGWGRRTPPDPIYPPGYGLALCAVPRGRGGGDGGQGIGGGGAGGSGGAGGPTGSMCAGGICTGMPLGAFAQVNYQDGENDGNGNAAPGTGPCAGISIGKMQGESWCDAAGRLGIEAQKCLDKEGPLRRDCNSECDHAYRLQLCDRSLTGRTRTMAYCLGCSPSITPSCHALKPLAACCLKLQNAQVAAMGICLADTVTKRPSLKKPKSFIRKIFGWLPWVCGPDDGDDGS